MCGRYQFSVTEQDGLAQIAENARRRAARLGQAETAQAPFPAAGDICPAGTAPVLVARGGRIVGAFQTWGMRRYGKTIINARAETATEKPMFRRNILDQRCVIPASAYYEWDAGRHKYRFSIPGQPLYFAGLYDVDAQTGGDRFVILTTKPNAAVQDIHDRMPLILRREDVRPWLTDHGAALALLGRPSPPLRRTCTDGQLRMQDLPPAGGPDGADGAE